MRDTPTTTNPEDERAYARIEQALASLGAEHSPPPGWEEQVLSAVDEEEKRRNRQPKTSPKTSWWHRLPATARWLLPTAPVAMAAAALLLWFPTAPPDEPPGPILVARIAAQNVPIVRGSDCTINHGEQLTLSSNAKHRELRVYRQGNLVFRCGTSTAKEPDAAGQACRVNATEIIATWIPQLLGTHSVLAVASNRPLPALTGSLDSDGAALEEKHIRLHREEAFNCQ